MSQPFNPDDFNIDDFLSSVDFDHPNAAPEPPEQPGEPAQPVEPGFAEDALSTTGEYVPVRSRMDAYDPGRGEGWEEQEETMVRAKAPLGLRILKKLLFILIWLLLIVIAGYFLAGNGWKWGSDLLALNKEELTAEVTLEKEWFTEEEALDDEGNPVTYTVADMDAVSQELQDNGLIEYPWLFKLFARFTHKDRALVAGTYELSTDMDYSALLRGMGPVAATRETVLVMIPEGYTVEQILECLAEQGVADLADLQDAAANYDFNYDFVKGLEKGEVNRLEGFLFPDTYEFYVDMDAATALARMLANMKSKFSEDMQRKAASLGYTMEEIITVASIVEKETDGVDQTSIASVIYNRLSNTSSGTNGYLQMDSTIQYVLEERKENLTAEDLAVDSPYNTYLYKGLPQGPICCPGLEAIEAALNPVESDYLYFILGDDGSTHFFADYAEFLAFKDAQTGEMQESEDEAVYEG